MKTKEKKEQAYKEQAYMDNYKEMLGKLHILSRMAVRQFLGTRDERDPRVKYLTGVESFKNLANVQLSVLLRLATEKLGVKKADFLAMSEDELKQQIASMEESLAVTGWNKDGTPVLDLQAHLERTKEWPK